jgi:hypothetical protein
MRFDGSTFLGAQSAGNLRSRQAARVTFIATVALQRHNDGSIAPPQWHPRVIDSHWRQGAVLMRHPETRGPASRQFRDARLW